jgi:hypothetical protein
MPGFMLHIGSQVICAHGGQAQPTVPSPRVFVSGQPVVAMAAPWVVAGCALPPPPAANGPCITSMWLTGSLRVLSLGQPLLLIDSLAICAPSATPLIPMSCQTRVVAQ